MYASLQGNEAGLVGYWNFEEGVGGTAHDLTTSNNHGSLNNMTTSTAWTACLTLTINKEGLGTVVTEDPNAINCGTDCNERYDGSMHITLAAIPDEGFEFSYWTTNDDWEDNCNSKNNPLILNLDTDRTCTAVFEGQLPTNNNELSSFYPVKYLPLYMKLTVEIVGLGAVVSNPSGINVNSYGVTDCVYRSDFLLHCLYNAVNSDFSFPTGTWVELVVKPDVGYRFVGWGGNKDCVNEKLFMNSHKVCIAYFSAID